MKHKRIVFSTLLIFLVLVILGFPFYEWGFDRDDCGVIYNSFLTSITDFFQLFYRNDIHSMVHSSNYEAPGQYFFSVFYRPLTFFWYALQLPLFGANAYGYYLVMIGFHAINVVLFFNMILPLFQVYSWSFLSALFFAFHGSLWKWMGWIAAQAYTISMTFIMLATMFYFSYLKTKRLSHCFLSIFCFTISLFTFEFVIVFPIFLVALYFSKEFFISRGLIQNYSFFNYTKKTLGHWGVFFSYLALRLYLFPIDMSKDPNSYRLSLFKFLIDLKKRLGDLKSFIVDVLGLSWVPASFSILKIGLAIFMILVFSYFFYRIAEKGSLMVLGLSASIFLWPAVLRYFVPRYLYYSLPIYIFLMFFLAYSVSNKSFKFRLWAYGLLGCLVILNSASLFSRMQNKMTLLKQANDACDALALDPRIQNKILCFVGVPRDVFWTGLAQQIWLRGTNRNKPIYYDMSTFSVCRRDGINYMSIRPIKGGFRFISKDPKKLWWIAWGGECTKMGEKIVHYQHNDRLYDFDIIFKQEFAQQDLTFISWDYEKNGFVFL